MGQINWNRVLVGGIIPGIIIDVIQWLLNGIVLGGESRQTMLALGRPLQENASTMVFFVGLGLVYGIVIVGLYASVRPRFGAGPKTVLFTALSVWLLGYCLPTVTWLPMGLFPRHLVVMAVLVGLVEIIIATVVGAWLYQESSTGAGSTVRQAA
jgi:hypothetical protein